MSNFWFIVQVHNNLFKRTHLPKVVVMGKKKLELNIDHRPLLIQMLGRQ